MVGYTRNYALWCLRCHTRFKGRKNAKFCCDACRLANWQDKKQAIERVFNLLVLQHVGLKVGVEVEKLVSRVVADAVESNLSGLETALLYAGWKWSEWKRKFLVKKVMVKSVKIGSGFVGDFGAENWVKLVQNWC